MELQTKVNIVKSLFKISPTDRLLFVGSCFAENIGRRFVDNQFDAIVNPYGTMYNPASVYHSVKSALEGVSGSLPTEGSPMLITSEYVQSGGRGRLLGFLTLRHSRL